MKYTPHTHMLTFSFSQYYLAFNNYTIINNKSQNNNFVCPVMSVHSQKINHKTIFFNFNGHETL